MQHAPTLPVHSAALVSPVSAVTEQSATMLTSVRMERTFAPHWLSVPTSSAALDALVAARWTTIKPDSLAMATLVRILTSATLAPMTVPMLEAIVSIILAPSSVPVPRVSRVMAKCVQ